MKSRNAGLADIVVDSGAGETLGQSFPIRAIEGDVIEPSLCSRGAVGLAGQSGVDMHYRAAFDAVQPRIILLVGHRRRRTAHETEHRFEERHRLGELGRPNIDVADTLDRHSARSVNPSHKDAR